MASRSGGTARKSTSRRSTARRTATTDAVTTRADAPATTAATPATPASRAATVQGQTREAAARTKRAVPLAKREAEAQRKGYVGADASDTDLSATRPPITSGVGKEQGAPGGHPNDPTSKESVGAAR